MNLASKNIICFMQMQRDATLSIKTNMPMRISPRFPMQTRVATVII